MGSLLEQMMERMMASSLETLPEVSVAVAVLARVALPPLRRDVEVEDGVAALLEGGPLDGRRRLVVGGLRRPRDG